jgi:hypothetical protein
VRKIFEPIKIVVKFMFGPAPSRFVFFALVGTTTWLSFQVEIQGNIMRMQMEDINWLLSLLKTAVFLRR